MTATCFVQWPVELLTNIFDRLDDPSALAFRSVCHAICHRTANTFTQRFIQSFAVRFTVRDLQNLVDVANDPKFGPSVEMLTLRLERWNHDNLHAKLYVMTRTKPEEELTLEDLIFDRNGITHPFRHARMRRRRAASGVEGSEDENHLLQDEQAEIRRRVEVFDRDLAERQRLLMSDEAHLLLSAALAKLSSLRAVTLIDRSGRVCWDAGGAMDGIPCGNGVHGSWQRLAEETRGLRRLQMIERHSLLTDLLRSMPASATLPHLAELHVDFAEYELTHKPKTIPPYLAAQLLKLSASFTGCANDFERRGMARYGPPEDHQCNEPTNNLTWLSTWVNSCRKLKSLTLEFPVYTLARQVSSIAGSVKLTSLEHFGLSGGLMDFRSEQVYQELVAFLDNHRATLKHLDLADIYLSGATQQESDNAPGPRDFLRHLSTFQHLEKLTFLRWREKPNFGDGYGRYISFSSSTINEEIHKDAKRPWTFGGSSAEVSAELVRLSSAYTSSSPI